jgi:hypothetical protein
MQSNDSVLRPEFPASSPLGEFMYRFRRVIGIDNGELFPSHFRDRISGVFEGMPPRQST